MEESLLAPLTTDSTSMLQESQFRTVGSGKTRMRKTANCFDSCDKSLSVDVEKKNTCSSSAQDLEQHSAYNKAIEILRKEESVEVVEVLIEYAEWM